ncbi:MAG: sulfatase [Saprospiraceae bacterium]|nr:sulfatase [Lewinella sp.]
MKCLKLLVLLPILLNACRPSSTEVGELPNRPNILFAISDDQSFAHTSFAGAGFVNTPAFDQIAKNGVYFRNCLSGSPGCAPSRSAIVTGRYHWQNEQSGQHASGWLKKYVPFVDLLTANGYYTGYTGKGVGPFKYGEIDSLREENAAGKAYSSIRYQEGTEEDERFGKFINAINYAANFEDFLSRREVGKPFFFWYGATEPHRAYQEGIGLERGKKLEDVEVPAFFPDVATIRSDLLDYAVEIEWFDLHLQRMLEHLESIGELENTVVIVTSDNGMPFPRAKANGYEYGIHVPFAVSFPKAFPPGRQVDDLISFVDLAPTILELTGTSSEGMLPISGKSFMDVLTSEQEGLVDASRQYAFNGRERHSSSRYRNLGYPQRMIRDGRYLLTWNQRPARWPAGAPQRLDPEGDGALLPMYGLDENGIHHSEWAFTDVDACPAKSYLVEHSDNDSIRYYFDLAYAKRPEFEFFDIQNDPACLNNLSGNPEYRETERRLKEALVAKLKATGDPRAVGPNTEIFDTYTRYSPIRDFPEPDWYIKN